MEISKVTVNGKEFTVTDNKLTGLKTGDKVEVTFAKIPPTKEETDKAFKEKALSWNLQSEHQRQRIPILIRQVKKMRSIITRQSL